MKMKPLLNTCKSAKCAHPKCDCGHCSRYHFHHGECMHVAMNLHTCMCKELKVTKKTP